jgi:hypothetical protein
MLSNSLTLATGKKRLTTLAGGIQQDNKPTWGSEDEDEGAVGLSGEIIWR